ILTVDLRRSVAPWDLVVLAPVLEAAELGAAQAEVGARERLGGIGAGLQDDRGPFAGVELGRESVGPLQTLRVDVVEHQSASRERRRVDDIVDHRGAERETSGADQRDLRAPHGPKTTFVYAREDVKDAG